MSARGEGRSHEAAEAGEAGEDGRDYPGPPAAT